MASPEWQGWCRGAQDILVEGAGIVVTTGDSRKQRVSVVLTDDTFELESVVARASMVESLEGAELATWGRNRSSQLVGFGFDRRGRLMARAWVPRAGATAEEFLSALRHVAAEADLLEYQLTGVDRE